MEQIFLSFSRQQLKDLMAVIHQIYSVPIRPIDLEKLRELDRIVCAAYDKNRTYND